MAHRREFSYLDYRIKSGKLFFTVDSLANLQANGKQVQTAADRDSGALQEIPSATFTQATNTAANLVPTNGTYGPYTVATTVVGVTSGVQLPKGDYLIRVKGTATNMAGAQMILTILDLATGLVTLWTDAVNTGTGTQTTDARKFLFMFSLAQAGIATFNLVAASTGGGNNVLTSPLIDVKRMY